MPRGPRTRPRCGCWPPWLATSRVPSRDLRAASRQRRLLHRHRLPTAVPPEEDPCVADLAGERDAAKGAGVVGDAGEHGDVAVDPHGQTVVLHRRQPQRTSRRLPPTVGAAADAEYLAKHDNSGGRILRVTIDIPN